MLRSLVAFSVGFAGLISAGTAHAATWADYEEAFVAFPCHDGWIACYQDGRRIDPDLRRGSSGFPHPANARVDFFDLTPTAVFSPFVSLSDYPLGGTAPVAAADPIDPGTPEPMPYGDPVDPSPAPDGAPSGEMGRHQEPAPAPAGGMARPDAATDGVADAAPASGGMVRPGSGPAPASGGMVRPGSGPAPASGGMVRPGSGPAPASGGMVRPGSGPAPASGGMVRPGSESVAAVQSVVAPTPEPGGMVRPDAERPTEPEPAPAAEVTCDNLVAMEPKAMIGRLADEEIACLEASFADAERQTDKKKISLLLIANANGKGDKRTWSSLVRRHLEEIDQSDPDLCYAYAAYLARKGPSRAEGVIRWSEVALENRTRWVGETYKTRVNALYKLRAAAANTLWQQAEERHAAAPSDETEEIVERARGRVKTYAREWYEYAKEAGKDTTTPLQLCISAAGTSEFCEGG